MSTTNTQLYTTKDLMNRFNQEFKRAQKDANYDVTAMSLATIDKSQTPQIRIVLLKEAQDLGFVFFTNYLSQKGQDLKAHTHAALCFYWHHINVQIRVKGICEEISSQESDAYFSIRPRGSQIGAHASKQSQPLVSRADLLNAYQSYESQFKDKQVPRPAHWGGYLLKPYLIEFWYAEESRLHQRYLYTKQNNPNEHWQETLLNP